MQCYVIISFQIDFNIQYIINQQDATLAVLCLLKTTINTTLPELHLVGLLYIIDL